MFNLPFTIPNNTLYDELNVEPEATAHEIGMALVEAVRRIENKRRALEKQLSAVYDEVEDLKEVEQEIEREAAKPSDVNREIVAVRRDELSRLRRRAQEIDPRYVDMREELTALKQRKTALNRINLQSNEQRDDYDSANPPLDLLKLERDERNPFSRDESLDLNTKTTLALLRHEISSYLAELGEDVFHPSDLTRESFAEDFVFNPLIDESDE
jgi:chromosome segregation ATPase